MIDGSIYINESDKFQPIKTMMEVKQPGLTAWKSAVPGNDRTAAIRNLESIVAGLKAGRIPFGRRIVILLDVEEAK